MFSRQLIPLLVIAVVASGCTTQAWYAGTQAGAENECKHKPAGEVDRCLARLNKMSYEEYQQARAGKEP
jgi:outer membrane lipoprotein-sorting protein